MRANDGRSIVQVSICDLLPTDEVVDVYGGTHKLRTVLRLVDGTIRIKHEDGTFEYFGGGSPVVIVARAAARPCTDCAARGRFTWSNDDGTCRRH